MWGPAGAYHVPDGAVGSCLDGCCERRLAKRTCHRCTWGGDVLHAWWPWHAHELGHCMRSCSGAALHMRCACAAQAPRMGSLMLCTQATAGRTSTGPAPPGSTRMRSVARLAVMAISGQSKPMNAARWMSGTWHAYGVQLVAAQHAVHAPSCRRLHDAGGAWPPPRTARCVRGCAARERAVQAEPARGLPVFFSARLRTYNSGPYCGRGTGAGAGACSGVAGP